MKVNAPVHKLLPILLLLVQPAVVQALDYTYTSNGSEITIIGYTGAGGDIIIPDTISSLPVTTIGTFAFYEGSNLTSVTIPDLVTSIEQSAFEDCYNLMTVIIPDGVASIGNDAFSSCTSLMNFTFPELIASIGDYAFSSCSSLTSLTIPENLTSIGERAFLRCNSLTNITADSLNNSYSSIDGVLFNKSMNTLIRSPGGKVGNYNIPSGVTTIEAYGFYDCNSLMSITIPDGVTSIEGSTFGHCDSLTSVTIPDSITSIKSFAFSDCGSLTSVYMKGNAPSLSLFGNFIGTPNAIIYYMPGTTGWNTTFGGRPTVLWNPVIQTDDGSFGVQANKFGFNIAESLSGLVVVEFCSNLTDGIWVPVETNSMSNGAVYFSDADWFNHPGRYYRLSMP